MSKIRAMCLGDVNRVIKIIEAHDDDDSESAQSDFDNFGFEGHYVLEVDDKVVGVTGFREVEGTDRSYWLSWTYLDEAYRGKGLGKSMCMQLIDTLKERNARKLFAKISNYESSDDGKIYEAAFNLYKTLGFEEAVTSKDFYDEGEDQIIMAFTLEQNPEVEGEFAVQDEKPIIRFNGMHEIAESDGAYTFSWTVTEKFTLFGKRSFTVEDLAIGLRAVKEGGGRKVFLTFPSNLPLIHKPLQAAGFKYVGQIEDYYERGVHEMHFTHDLTQI